MMDIRPRTVLLALVVLAGSLPLRADTYDERLEYIATDGTQWADTGVRLHFRNSKFQVRFRILDYATTSQTLFGGMTDVKNNAGGNYKSFAIGTKPTGNVKTDKSLVAWNEGSDSNSYFWPITGKFQQSGAFTIEGWRHWGYFNGFRTGYSGYESSKPDKTSGNTFYLGACNNAGDGVLAAHPEEKIRIHWYGARFWNNIPTENDMSAAELIGDFIPVRKGSEIGFFDLVTETFHPSISGVAFTAPERVVWKGGNDGKLTEDANWVGGHAPTGVTQVAEFPAGVEIRYPTADIAGFFNNLGGVRLDGADTLLWLTNLNVSGSHKLFPPISGPAGTFRVESKQNSSAYGLYMFADNGAFRGLIDITNCYTYGNSPYAFGEYGFGKTRYFADFNNIRLYDPYNHPIWHGDLDLGPTGQIVFTADAVTFDGRLGLLTSNKAFNANGNGRITFNCDIEDVAGTRRTCYLFSGAYYTGSAVKSRDFGKVQVQVATFYVTQPLHFARQNQSFTIYDQCNLALNTGSSTGLRFGCENALNDETFLLMCYATDISSKPKNVVDLNGYSQRVGMLGMYTGGFDGTKVWNTNAVIRSATPATLTILETYRCDHNDGTGSYSSAYPGLVSGAASIVLDDAPIVSPAGSSKRMRFNAPGSDTSGFLQANGGYIEIRPTATFPNLTGLVATKTGVVKVQTAAIGTATNLCVMVKNATTAKIEIASGVTLRADTAFMGTKWLEAGRYSSVASAGVKACPELAGTGILEVENYGGVKGFVLFFH